MKAQVVEQVTVAQAKTAIAQTAALYVAKDANGRYRIDRRRARPVCLMGPAGIGKTEVVRQVAEELPELPDAKKARFVEKLGLTRYDAMVICENREVADFFEKAAAGHDAKKVANRLMGDFFAMLKRKNLTIEESPVSAESLGRLVDLIEKDVISGKIAKDVFEIMSETGEDPEKIVEEKGLKQVTDTGAIEAIVDKVIAENPDKVNAYKGGKVGLMGWFVGQVIKESRGKANPQVVNRLLAAKLA